MNELGPFESITLDVIKLQLLMTNEQRVQFWAVIQHTYCPDCGKPVGGSTCLCDPDKPHQYDDADD